VHFARHFITEGGLVYDIGCSTGNIGQRLRPYIEARHAEYIPIDSSPDMAERYQGPGQIVVADAMAFDFKHADVFIVFLAMMFFPPSIRRQWLYRVTQSLKPGGAVILFDKCESRGGYVGTATGRLSLAMKNIAGVEAQDIIAKELSIVGVQRPLHVSEIPVEAVEIFRCGEFAGWVIARDPVRG